MIEHRRTSVEYEDLRLIKMPSLTSLLLFILIASGCSERHNNSSIESNNDNILEEDGSSMWRDYKSSFTQEYSFNTPATDKEIARISEKLDVVCPDELSQLLLETNGIDDEWDSPFIYSTLRIVNVNVEERSSDDNKEMELSYDDMLLFSDAGNGDYFGYVVKEGIYVADHEEGSRTKVASSLREFIKGWTAGEISI
ncbi:SMI1/KNR4 family protein [Cohnella sp. GbtcB17]|uniref:SMI1/KNR4 family protein n=1 Tax=Cohnella sp. GbtcB17 TaxID=2824762 RepID=UPI0020C6F88B|nr:SMI1/KNR4 family protein [Cohnella sp. GbtcB17]